MFQRATKSKQKLRLGLEGPSGSGKTMGGLLIAKGMGGRIALIDTEEGSASLYADRFDFDTAQLKPPFTPERYAEHIHGAEEAGYDIIVIDSGSHEWIGGGGVLEIHDAMPGNSYTNWAKVNPRHDLFVQAILRSKAHIIVTFRAKQKHELVESNGKKEVKKLGMGIQQREGMDFELTAVLTMNSGKAMGSKDRTGLFPEDHWFKITEDTGKRLMDWLEDGVDPKADAIAMLKGAKSLNELVTIWKAKAIQWKALMGFDEIEATKDELKAKFTAEEAA
jgi:hypothetical protein